MRLRFLLPLLLIGSGAFAQTDSLRIGSLPEIEIVLLRGRDSLMRLPASVGMLSPAELQHQNTTDISTAINLVSGVAMQSANFTTSRIAIRGIGARTAFGTNKIRAFYSNIPLTSGNSETVIDDLDLENLSGVEILKGGMTAAYGSGLGGAILLKPFERKMAGAQLDMTSVAGSYGLRKNRVRYARSGSDGTLNVNYHHIQSDGWRQNSPYRRDGLGLSGTALRKEKRQLEYITHYTRLKSFLPSSIGRSVFDTHPEQAAPTWLAAKGFKEYDAFLGGLSYEAPVGERLTVQASVSAHYKYNHEARPFDILRQRTLALGGRGQLSWKGDKAQFITGFEFFRDDYSGRTAENRYAENDGRGSLEGALLSEQKQRRHFCNLFLIGSVELTDKWEAGANLNYHRNGFSLDPSLPDAAKQDFRYDAVLSPGLNLSYRPSHRLTVYGAISHGFSLPSVDETLLADGSINTAIRPEKGISSEVGMKSYWFGRRLYAELTFFRMDIRDMLVARRIGDDQYTGANAGKVRSQGAELTLKANARAGRMALNGHLTASCGDYRFREFRDGDADHSGNRLTNVPAARVAAGITAEMERFFLSGDFRFTGRLPVNDANDAYADAWKTLDLKAGYRFGFRTLELLFSAGLNNVFDARYAAMVQPNALPSGGNPPRFFYPGMPRHMYGMFQLRYDLGKG